MSGDDDGMTHRWADVAGTVRVFRGGARQGQVHLFDIMASSAYDLMNAEAHRHMMAKLGNAVCDYLDQEARKARGLAHER